eukprot:g52821.t1
MTLALVLFLSVLPSNFAWRAPLAEAWALVGIAPLLQAPTAQALDHRQGHHGLAPIDADTLLAQAQAQPSSQPAGAVGKGASYEPPTPNQLMADYRQEWSLKADEQEQEQAQHDLAVNSPMNQYLHGLGVGVPTQRTHTGQNTQASNKLHGQDDTSFRMPDDIAANIDEMMHDIKDHAEDQSKQPVESAIDKPRSSDVAGATQKQLDPSEADGAAYHNPNENALDARLRASLDALRAADHSEGLLETGPTDKSAGPTPLQPEGPLHLRTERMGHAGPALGSLALESRLGFYDASSYNLALADLSQQAGSRTLQVTGSLGANVRLSLSDPDKSVCKSSQRPSLGAVYVINPGSFNEDIHAYVKTYSLDCTSFSSSVYSWEYAATKCGTDRFELGRITGDFLQVTVDTPCPNEDCLKEPYTKAIKTKQSALCADTNTGGRVEYKGSLCPDGLSIQWDSMRAIDMRAGLTEANCKWVRSATDSAWNAQWVGTCGTPPSGVPELGFPRRCIDLTEDMASLIRASTFLDNNVEDEISGQTWQAVSAPKVFWKGYDALDLNTQGLLVYSERDNAHQIGSHHTFAAWVWWRDADTEYRTLFRNSDDHMPIINAGTKKLGMWSNRNGNFQDSGYEITNDMSSWQLVVATGVQSGANSFEGTSTFYTAKSTDSRVTKRGTAARVLTGTTLMTLGFNGQGPGYVTSAMVWNRVLSEAEMNELLFRGPKYEGFDCMLECKRRGFCCLDPTVGSNQFLSCSQACFIRQRGLGEAACLALCVQGGCAYTGPDGTTYPKCNRCSDLTTDPKCLWGVGSSQACETGCKLGQGVCARPATFCSNPGSLYQRVDCNGDQQQDHVCTDLLEQRGLILTNPDGSCAATQWPNAPVDSCLAVFGKGMQVVDWESGTLFSGGLQWSLLPQPESNVLGAQPVRVDETDSKGTALENFFVRTDFDASTSPAKKPGDGLVGVFESSRFVLTGGPISWWYQGTGYFEIQRVGGGSKRFDGTLTSVTPVYAQWKSDELLDFIGHECIFRIADDKTGSWGHFAIDNIRYKGRTQNCPAGFLQLLGSAATLRSTAAGTPEYLHAESVQDCARLCDEQYTASSRDNDVQAACHSFQFHSAMLNDFCPTMVLAPLQLENGILSWPGPPLSENPPQYNIARPAGNAQFNFICSAATTIIFRLRVTSPDANSDSLYHSVDSTNMIVWETGRSVNQWSSVSSSFSVDKGLHVLYLKGREDGLSISDIQFQSGDDKCAFVCGGHLPKCYLFRASRPTAPKAVHDTYCSRKGQQLVEIADTNAVALPPGVLQDDIYLLHSATNLCKRWNVCNGGADLIAVRPKSNLAWEYYSGGAWRGFYATDAPADTLLAKLSTKRCAPYLVDIGPQAVAKYTKVVGVSSLDCPAVVDKGNWLMGSEAANVFAVSTQGNTVNVSQTGLFKDQPWTLDLKFYCCRAEVCRDQTIQNCCALHGSCQIGEGQCTADSECDSGLQCGAAGTCQNKFGWSLSTARCCLLPEESPTWSSLQYQDTPQVEWLAGDLTDFGTQGISTGVLQSDLRLDWGLSFYSKNNNTGQALASLVTVSGSYFILASRRWLLVGDESASWEIACPLLGLVVTGKGQQECLDLCFDTKGCDAVNYHVANLECSRRACGGELLARDTATGKNYLKFFASRHHYTSPPNMSMLFTDPAATFFNDKWHDVCPDTGLCQHGAALTTQVWAQPPAMVDWGDTLFFTKGNDLLFPAGSVPEEYTMLLRARYASSAPAMLVVNYCTVVGNQVQGVYASYQLANAALAGQTGSRMICQVYGDGSVEKDPQNLKKGNMWWWDWLDIDRMNSLCAADKACTTPVASRGRIFQATGRNLVAGWWNGMLGQFYDDSAWVTRPVMPNGFQTYGSDDWSTVILRNGPSGNAQYRDVNMWIDGEGRRGNDKSPTSWFAHTPGKKYCSVGSNPGPEACDAAVRSILPAGVAMPQSMLRVNSPEYPRGCSIEVSATATVADVCEKTTASQLRNKTSKAYVSCCSMNGNAGARTLKGVWRTVDKFDRDGFNAWFLSSPRRLIRRLCSGCQASHKEIYYRRKTQDQWEPYQYMWETWSITAANKNEPRIDFELYSTLADALADMNPWQFFNGDDPGVGFPRDSSPTASTAFQWNSLSRGGQQVEFSVFVGCSSTVTVNVGTSLSSAKTITMSTEVWCPPLVNKNNWLGGFTHPDWFEVTVSGKQVNVTRKDAVSGWGVDLKFECCEDKACSGLMTYHEAEDFCASAGMRLCRPEELNKACGSGCAYDFELVWTQATPEWRAVFNELESDSTAVTQRSMLVCSQQDFVAGWDLRADEDTLGTFNPWECGQLDAAATSVAKFQNFEQCKASCAAPAGDGWHLAPRGATECDFGTKVAQTHCALAVAALAGTMLRKPGRALQTPSDRETWLLSNLAATNYRPGVYVKGYRDSLCTERVGLRLESCSGFNKGFKYWHLAPTGSLTCDYGVQAAVSECQAAVELLASQAGMRPGRGIQVGSGGACNDGGWGAVPLGCSAQTSNWGTAGGDWSAHFKTSGVHCPHPAYQLVCGSPGCTTPLTANVGISETNTKTITMSTDVWCPPLVNKDNWLGGFTFPDWFEVTVLRRVVTVRRMDGQGGWGMPLSFQCCPAQENTVEYPPPTVPPAVWDLANSQVEIKNAPYGNGIYKASNSSQWSGPHLWPPAGAFDKKPGFTGGVSGWHLKEGDDKLTAWLQLEMPAPIMLTAVSIEARKDCCFDQTPSSFVVRASNNGTDWVVVHNQSNGISFAFGGEQRRYEITSATAATPYRFFRLTGFSNTAAVVSLSEWRLFGRPPEGSCEQALDLNSNSQWRPACEKCGKGEAWLSFSADEPLGCLEASNLGVGSIALQSWNGGLALERRNDGQIFEATNTNRMVIPVPNGNCELFSGQGFMNVCGSWDGKADHGLIGLLRTSLGDGNTAEQCQQKCQALNKNGCCEWRSNGACNFKEKGIMRFSSGNTDTKAIACEKSTLTRCPLFSNPQSNKVLAGLVNATAFSTLQEAQLACCNTPECNGITFQGNPANYTMRRGTELLDSTETSLSWLEQTAGKCPERDQGGWEGVPSGCSTQAGGDWTAYYKTGGADCNNGKYRLVCSGTLEPRFPDPLRPGYVWQKVFRQKAPAWSTQGQFSYNPQNPDANLFSLLDQMDQFKSDGMFEFLLFYPERANLDMSMGHWTQTSNPLQTNVTGYKAVDVPWEGKGYWAGIAVSSTRSALLDGSPDHVWWWNAIGSTVAFTTSGSTVAAIPGPYPEGVTEVELYAAAPAGQKVCTPLAPNPATITSGSVDTTTKTLSVTGDWNTVLAVKGARPLLNGEVFGMVSLVNQQLGLGLSIDGTMKQGIRFNDESWGWYQDANTIYWGKVEQTSGYTAVAGETNAALRMSVDYWQNTATFWPPNSAPLTYKLPGAFRGKALYPIWQIWNSNRAVYLSACPAPLGGCPPEFPFQIQCSQSWNGKVCYNQQSYATACSGVFGSFCGLPGAPASLYDNYAAWGGKWCFGSEPPNAVMLGNMGNGVACQDGEKGKGYIMLLASSWKDRGLKQLEANNADRFLCVRFQNNHWEYDDDGNWQELPVQDGDLLVAAVDFAQRSVLPLAGQCGYMEGVRMGYIRSDLKFTPNVWAGVSNPGEYTPSGTWLDACDTKKRLSCDFHAEQILPSWAPLAAGVPKTFNARGFGISLPAHAGVLGMKFKIQTTAPYGEGGRNVEAVGSESKVLLGGTEVGKLGALWSSSGNIRVWAGQIEYTAGQVCKASYSGTGIWPADFCEPGWTELGRVWGVALTPEGVSDGTLNVQFQLNQKDTYKNGENFFIAQAVLVLELEGLDKCPGQERCNAVQWSLEKQTCQQFVCKRWPAGLVGSAGKFILSAQRQRTRLAINTGMLLNELSMAQVSDALVYDRHLTNAEVSRLYTSFTQGIARKDHFKGCFGMPLQDQELSGCAVGIGCGEFATREEAERTCLAADTDCIGLTRTIEGHWETRAGLTPSPLYGAVSLLKGACEEPCANNMFIAREGKTLFSLSTPAAAWTSTWTTNKDLIPDGQVMQLSVEVRNRAHVPLTFGYAGCGGWLIFTAEPSEDWRKYTVHDIAACDRSAHSTREDRFELRQQVDGKGLVELRNICLRPASWVLAEEGSSCTEACRARHGECVEGGLNSVSLQMLKVLEQDLDLDCESYAIGLPNLALRKDARQSFTNYGGVASRAVDGNTETHWSHGSCIFTEGTNPWWRVDLGATFSLSYVQIWNRFDVVAASIVGWQAWVGVSDLPEGQNTWNTEGKVMCARGADPAQGGISKADCAGKVGRYVFIRLPPPSTYLSICEVRVYQAYQQIHAAADCCRGSELSRLSSSQGGAATPQDCEAACDALPACRFFSHSVTTKECVLCAKCELVSTGDSSNYSSWSKAASGLMNAGLACLEACGQSGRCAFCGTGLCCRKGYKGGEKGCRAEDGSQTQHVCVEGGMAAPSICTAPECSQIDKLGACYYSHSHATPTTCDLHAPFYSRMCPCEITEKSGCNNMEAGERFYKVAYGDMSPVMPPDNAFGWEPIEKSDRDSFNALFLSTPQRIIRRLCLECAPSHKEIYYRRKRQDQWEPYQYMWETWSITAANKNFPHIDFELYSTLADALADTNRWQFLNGDDRGVGFPRDSGPTVAVGNQWNSLTRGGQEVEFSIYVETYHPRCVRSTAAEAVARCCGEDPCPASLGGNVCKNQETYGNDYIFGFSQKKPDPCSGLVDYEGAVAFCEAYGLRLCTLQEMENRETIHTGCGYNAKHSWTSTSCGCVLVPHCEVAAQNNRECLKCEDGYYLKNKYTCTKCKGCGVEECVTLSCHPRENRDTTCGPKIAHCVQNWCGPCGKCADGYFNAFDECIQFGWMTSECPAWEEKAVRYDDYAGPIWARPEAMSTQSKWAGTISTALRGTYVMQVDVPTAVLDALGTATTLTKDIADKVCQIWCARVVAAQGITDVAEANQLLPGCVCLDAPALGAQCGFPWRVLDDTSTYWVVNCPLLECASGASILATCQRWCDAKAGCNTVNYNPTSGQCCFRTCSEGQILRLEDFEVAKPPWIKSSKLLPACTLKGAKAYENPSSMMQFTKVTKTPLECQEHCLLNSFHPTLPCAKWSWFASTQSCRLSLREAALISQGISLTATHYIITGTPMCDLPTSYCDEGTSQCPCPDGSLYFGLRTAETRFRAGLVELMRQNYVVKPGTRDCTNSAFGKDPLPGVFKQCICAPEQDMKVRCLAACASKSYACSSYGRHLQLESDGQPSCAQACMVKARGSSTKDCREQLCQQQLAPGQCSKEIAQQVYTFCGACEDPKLQNPIAAAPDVLSCLAGCELQPGFQYEVTKSGHCINLATNLLTPRAAGFEVQQQARYPTEQVCRNECDQDERCFAYSFKFGSSNSDCDLSQLEPGGWARDLRGRGGVDDSDTVCVVKQALVPSPSASPTRSASRTRTPSSSETPTNTPTPTRSIVPSRTPSPTMSPSMSSSDSSSSSLTPSSSTSTSITPSRPPLIPSSTRTCTLSPSPTPSRTASPTRTPTPSASSSRTMSRSASASASSSRSGSPSSSSSSSSSPSPSRTRSASSSISITPSATPTPNCEDCLKTVLFTEGACSAFRQGIVQDNWQPFRGVVPGYCLNLLYGGPQGPDFCSSYHLYELCTETVCSDELDDDRDGRVDCEDEDCLC